MRFSWAAKVALGAVLPVILGMGAFALLALGDMRDRVRDRIESELRHEVRLLARTLPDGEPLLRELAKALDARITVIAADGTVLADSEVADPTELENHGTRPEVLQAREEGLGIVQRYSRTVKRSLIYAATRVSGSEDIVRIARDVSDVEEEMAGIARTFWLVALVVLLIGLAVALMFARSVIHPVRQLTAAATARAAGELQVHALPQGRDEIGQLGRAYGEMTTKLDEALAGARAETARLEAILGGMTEGVVAVDAEERIVFLNSAARGILRLDEERASRGARLYDLVREPHILGLVQAAARDRKPAEAEFSDEGPPRRMVQLYAAPAGTDVILVLRDMSRVRRLERMRTDFVSNVSHELRTPLASIAAAVETLQDEEARADAETAERFLGILSRNVRRLEALLDDILALSRFESRPESLQRIPLDLASAGRAAADELGERARRRGIALEISGEPRLPVMGDAEALRRLVDNLIVNAITYTPEGGRVEIELGREDDEAVMRVRDTGIGIPASDLERIFERFYRVDKGRSRSGGGTGLGLAIVKHAVGFHGGTVTVESRLGEGSTFTVRLPLGRNGERD